MEKTPAKFQEDMNIEHMKRILEGELETSSVNGQLPCAAAFKIARKLKVTPRKVGDTANKLNIRIVNCQLGCFP